MRFHIQVFGAESKSELQKICNVLLIVTYGAELGSVDHVVNSGEVESVSDIGLNIHDTSLGNLTFNQNELVSELFSDNDD